MAFVEILVGTDCFKPCASCAAGVIRFFVHYLHGTIEQLEEALLKYMGEKDLKILKTEFPEEKWK